VRVGSVCWNRDGNNQGPQFHPLIILLQVILVHTFASNVELWQWCLQIEGVKVAIGIVFTLQVANCIQHVLHIVLLALWCGVSMRKLNWVLDPYK
jgi:hypothetical protein